MVCVFITFVLLRSNDKTLNHDSFVICQKKINKRARYIVAFTDKVPMLMDFKNLV